jgi:DNA-binding transcriptional ArsR family regulator
MSRAPSVSEVAAVVGNPARANVLVALLDGRALTAGELAYAAGVSPQTTSEHLGKMIEARLLVSMKQGRHRYYWLASPLVGRMLEAIMAVAPKDRRVTGHARATMMRCKWRAPAKTIWRVVSASPWPTCFPPAIMWS